MELRRQARDDPGIAAACLLAALGNESQETDPEFIRAMVGALILDEAIRDIRVLRKVWTEKS